MKKLVLLIVITILSSCKQNYFEKKYDKASNEANLKEVSKLISETDFNLLKNYIATSKLKNKDLEEHTYQELLLKAKDEYAQQVELKKEKEKIRRNTKYLCSKEWTEKEMALLIRLTDTTEASIAQAKEQLALGISGFKGLDMQYSIETNTYGTFLKGILGGSFRSTFTGDNRSFEKFYENGTFKSYRKKDSVNTTYIGDWNFNEANQLSRSIGSGTTGMYKKQYITYTIVMLNENTLLYYEDFNQPIITAIEMEHLPINGAP
ncbi:hypothetical protein [Croceivirga sp. JEA036]|uniref:hypothetical protein n=1 Tax=Croceivirga sp. JEA036 TaxID=2721162 RepID=UPI00143B6D46|nr:hypothetical protein [Croceivirga sp. JEA036]NJB35292.1 hypothetical protein [Croceivirga sp. JEA036]